MEAYKIGIKFFLKDSASLQLGDLVPVFHSWIQKQAIPGHLLVDVHDYSHIHQGPGILLVAHEGNFSLDMDQGRAGLLYYRKRPLDGSLQHRLSTILKATLEACRMLENDPGLQGKLHFRMDEFVLISNDRLHAPNEAETLSAIGHALSGVLQRLSEGAPFRLEPVASDPKERFMVRVKTGESVAAKDLIARLH